MKFRMACCGVALTVLLMLGLLASFSPPAFSQQVTAAITGIVTDSSGAAVAGATVTATDVERGTTFTAKTNDAGAYTFSRVPVGTYKVKAEAAGFQTLIQPPLTLDLNQTARVNFQMKVGSISESVEVSTSVPVLQTDTTSVNTIIDSKTNVDLPLATRNPVQLTLLAPGAVTVDTASMNLGSNTAEGGGRPYINGNREQANDFLLDGIDNNQVSENRLGLTPSPDAIQEFNLITQNASAEFGNYQGGIVNTTIKSGTNSYHGDVFEFFRNNIFNANKWENGLAPNPETGKDNPTPALRWNMFGGTFGGPILKNKLFFFGDYQGGRLDHPSTSGNITVLSPAERTGDFSALLTAATPEQLYNPCASGTGVPGNPCVLVAQSARVPFAGNIIPTNMLNPVYTNLVSSKLYPTQVTLNPANGFANATNTTSQQYNSNQGDVKVDFNASSKDRFFGRYSRGTQFDPSLNSFALLGNSANTATLDNVAADWTHTFTPNILNEARLGVNYVKFVDNDYTFPSSVGNFGTSIGITDGNPGGVDGLNLLGFGGGTITNQPAGTLQNLGQAITFEDFASTVIQFDDNLIISHGRHVFHSGFQMNRYRINVFYAGNGGELGMELFSGIYSGNGANGTGDPAADFALGLPELVGRGVSGGGGGAWHQQDWLFAGYFQDDWRVTDTLTLNLGLRYEARTPWVETDNRQVNVNIYTGALEYAGKDGNSRGLYNSVYGLPDFQPRVGFAWSPAVFDRNTVIRGAYSISSYLEGTGTNLRLTQNPPFTPPQTQASNNTTGGQNPFTTEAGPGAGSASSGDPFIGATMLAWDSTVQPAMSQQWNFSIQQQIARNLSLQLGYVGQHGTHLMVPLWLTQGELQPNGTVTPTPFVGGPNPAGGFGPNQFGAVKDSSSSGAMRYNALQAVLQKRYSSGLEAQVAYTYSKCMTDNSGYFGTWSSTTQATPASPYYQNLYNQRAEWAQCYWDIKHLISAYAVYELPYGHGRKYGNNINKVANAIAGDWSVNPIVSWHTGFPLALYGNDESGTGSQGARPDCNGPVSYPKTTSAAGLQWFNPGFMSNPAPGTFGTCPAQGPVIGPGYSDTDISLQKNFPFTESKYLQFRTDFLNAWNHPNFGKPNTSFGTSTTGVINTTQDARQLQFALKFYF